MEYTNDQFKDSDINLPDPFLERCTTKKRRDSFPYEGEPSKRCRMDPYSKGVQAGSTDDELCDPFEDYLSRTKSSLSSSVTTTYRRRTVSIAPH